MNPYRMPYEQQPANGDSKPDPIEVVAWRCEHCKRFQPRSVESTVIHVDEPRTEWSGAIVKRKSRFIRRMVVCPPCRRSITDQKEG